MFTEDLIRYLQDAREREVEAQLHLRQLLRGRRPELRWLRPRRRAERRIGGR
jgi:hypothetical protein